MVSITGTCTVVPNEATPTGPLWLSECDQMSPWTHAPSIYIYKPNPNNSAPLTTAFETMTCSLSQLLVYYYPLAGRLRWIGGGRQQVDCNAKGALLLEAQSSKKLEEYGDFVPDGTIDELVPKVDYSKPIEDLPLLVVQVTRFACGSGICVGIAISHAMADGVSAIHFINSWAKLARGESLGKDEMPFLDRTVLKASQPLIPPPFEHRELKQPLPLLLGRSDNMEERKKETTVALLKVTGEQVEKLRKKANEKSESNNTNKNSSNNGTSSTTTSTRVKQYSRYEVIGAHMWKCVCKARGSDPSQPTVFRLIAGIRNKLNPPLPQHFFGNAVLRTVSPTCHCGDIMSKPLGYAAQNIREAVEILTGEYSRSQIDFVAGQEDVTKLRAAYHTLGCTEAPFFGNPNITVVGWMGLALYDADFGWGKPEYMGPGRLVGEGKGFVMSTPGADGSLVIAIRLQTPHIEPFRQFFYQDI